ncbi:hypothetical protein RJ641_035162 [Dillenia turbinata]|uniref:protein-tyrosine-phosphatase n=1 Tax=Dillenia turbinata TaxID=194707 RepID=A0AAN8VWV4_9MAGN
MERKLNVYIWDMDETQILLKSLLNGTYAEAFNGFKDVQKGVEIGRLWEDYILQISDDHFFYDQIENYNEPFLDALSEYDDGRDLSDYDFCQDGIGAPYCDVNKRKLVYKHRIMAHSYKQGLHKILDHKMLKSWNDLYEMTDKYTDRWLSSARAFLEQCSGAIIGSSNSELQHVNVLVTSGSLIPSLVKCLLFRLDDLIELSNVYSSWEAGKFQCFTWIKERFSGQNVRFCVIGDGWEECEAAQSMRWPYIKIDLQPGGAYRFPGLTLRTVGHYLAVIYGATNAKNDEDPISQSLGQIQKHDHI